jgi:hypothetical protein
MLKQGHHCPRSCQKREMRGKIAKGEKYHESSEGRRKERD